MDFHKQGGAGAFYIHQPFQQDKGPVTKGTRAVYVSSFDLKEREVLQSSNKLDQLP